MLGFLAWDTVRHRELKMNSVDGIMAKNICSN